MQLPSILTPEPGLILWMCLAFFIVFFALAKWGFPAIISMVEERKRYIDESLKSAREANAKLANIKSESDAIIQQAREQQSNIIREAMSLRDQIVDEARSKAQEESKKILEEAKSQIAVERENALREIRSTVADLSIGIAEKLMLRQLDNKGEQEKFIDRILQNIDK